MVGGGNPAVGVSGANLTAVFGSTERVTGVTGVPGGAGSFAAEVRDRGGRAVSVDPVYGTPPDELVEGAKAGFARGLRYLDENRDSYVWTFFRGVEDLVARCRARGRKQGAGGECRDEGFHGYTP